MSAGTVKCRNCKEVKSLELMGTSKNFKNLCKSCHVRQVNESQLRNKIKNSINWVRPETARCSVCKENLDGRFFSINKRTCNGLQSVCKYHNTIAGFKRKCRSHLTMNLAKEEYFRLLQSPCFYCNSNDKMTVDRVNNNEPYTIENCVACCWKCNDMKGDLDPVEFLNQVENITNYRKKRLEEILKICSNT